MTPYLQNTWSLRLKSLKIKICVTWQVVQRSAVEPATGKKVTNDFFGLLQNDKKKTVGYATTTAANAHDCLFV